MLSMTLDRHSRSERGTDVLVGESRSREAPKNASVDELMKQLTDLEVENRQLRLRLERTDPPEMHSEARGLVLHCFGNEAYLDEPKLVSEDDKPVLRAAQPIRDVELYLYQHPEIAFVVYNDYGEAMAVTREGPPKGPFPDRQSIALITAEMKAAFESLVENIPNAASLFPDFDANAEIPGPYLPLYCCYPVMDAVLLKLWSRHQFLIRKLLSMVQEGYEDVYKLAQDHFQRGQTTRAYIATSWPKELSNVEQSEPSRNEDMADLNYLFALFNSTDRSLVSSSEHALTGRPDEQQAHVYEWAVNVWSWSYKGVLEKEEGVQTFRIKREVENQEYRIDDLDIYPRQYASSDVRSLLENRPKAFWKFREKTLVSHKGQGDESSGISTLDERYMIDMATYKALHVPHKGEESKTAQTRKRKLSDLTGNRPQKENSLYLFPPTILGYSMRSKKWVSLYLERISEVVWNEAAFSYLVLDPKTIDLILALVESRIALGKPTDLIAGRGTGLVMLFHGPPGSGKSFTAETVAEVARKPLYRFTCGDVGTGPESMENYIESILRIGTFWDCVILLEEADIFLEDRSQDELQRNAIASVLLRRLESFDGILILTTNRVRKFDEAFMARVHLALRYKKLEAPQRRTVWRNFINRLRQLDGANVDADGILENIETLSQYPMNGHEIRNAITNGRQLAQYRRERFGYQHLDTLIGAVRDFKQPIELWE